MVNVPAVFKIAVTQILFNTSRKVFYCSCTILQRKTIPQSRQHTFPCYAWSSKAINELRHQPRHDSLKEC